MAAAGAEALAIRVDERQGLRTLGEVLATVATPSPEETWLSCLPDAGTKDLVSFLSARGLPGLRPRAQAF